MRSSTRNRTGTSLSVQVSGLLLLTSVVACEPMERSAVVVDCSAENDVQYYRRVEKAIADEYTVDQFGYAWEIEADESRFWGDADPTLNGYPTTRPFPLSGFPLPKIEPIPGGGFCQEGEAAGTRHQFALHLQAIDHTFWGGLYTAWNLFSLGAEISFPDLSTTDTTTKYPADGIAFWARREIESDANIIIYLEDDESADLTSLPNDDENTARKPSVICIPADASSSTSGNVTTTSIDPNVQSSASAVPVISDPKACGNRWRADLELSEDWAFVKVPFSAFYKESVQPNKGTGVFDPTTKIRRFTFQYKGGQVISMWFDEAGLYREK